ncbi:hypothetical protein ACLB2K_032745 [Fragaria x ananassa]
MLGVMASIPDVELSVVLCGTSPFEGVLPLESGSDRCSFVLTGLVEAAAGPDLGFSIQDLSLDEKAEFLLVAQGVTTAAIVGVLYTVASTFQPLPQDIYRYGDICEVVDHIGGRYPEANLYAVGWSLGANILVRYLGQESDTCRLSGAVSLCNPFNLVIADEDFHKGFNNVYDKALSYALYYDCSYTWSSVYCSPMMMSMMMEALIQLTLHSH